MTAFLQGSSLVLQPIKPLKPHLPRNPRLPRTSISICVAEPRPIKNGGGGRRSSMEAGGGGAPRRRNPRKSSYGTSRRSVIKKSFAQEQVVFASPVAKDPAVAIIGAGISGLVCASTLEERGIRSTVFDTGVHGLGGRMATRMIDPQPLVFDHAAQFFTASDPRFQKLVDIWLEKGLVREWKGLLGELEAGGRFTPIPSSTAKYIGVKGMRPLADSILCQNHMVNIVRPCWISKLEPFNGMWYLTEKEKPHGHFDAIVIAHNAFKDPLSIPHNGAFTDFEGAFVKGVDSLSWMANNTSKLFPLHGDMPQCWTFFSTAAYGKRNKVPQENIPKVTAEKVKEDLLNDVEFALGLSKGSLQRPFYTRVQLWGAALPTNTPGIPCIFDPHGRAGICGDWLLGSSVEAAAISGLSLANHIADYFQSGGASPDDFAAGLHNEFHAVAGHDIGQFPGLKSVKQVREPQTWAA
ncbi:uncharacterized protein [Elaeis guineensis]|uniref:uncharacterized protein isoform X2 n=1 Tax=Elaeis guineensis var. tenera TaxID=51953 RepID=UPI003C6CCCC2